MDTRTTPSNSPSLTAELPTPSRSSRWRWSTTRGAALCGGAILATLSVGGIAGAATTHDARPPTSAHGPGPNGQGQQPTASGKITVLSGDDITISTHGSGTETVTYTSTTTFESMSGKATASALKVGEFIAAQGAKASDGDVTATDIMVSSGPPGRPGGQPRRGAPPKGGKGPLG
jgi:uncharacterized protein DUF5666